MRKLLLLSVIVLSAFFVNAQTVYTWTSSSLSSTSSASAYLTYPSPLEYDYTVYVTVNADTTVAGDSTILIHQSQISLNGTTWFDYGSADTLIKYADVAEKDEDYTYTTTPFVYFREKFTQQDTATTSLSGYAVVKKKY